MEANQYLQQNSQILQIYNIYRVGLSLILLLSFLATDTTTLGSHSPELFLYVSMAYSLFSLTTALSFSPQRQYLQAPRLISTMLVIDVIAIAFFSYASGGVANGLGLLLLITVAAGSILVSGIVSTFFAAIATISIIYGEIHLSLTSLRNGGQYVQAGLLGMLLFATSLYLQTISERMRRSAALTEQQASSITDLETLNELVIQRLRTGIIVIDAGSRILSRNSAAQTLLALYRRQPGEPASGDRLPDILAQQLAIWKADQQTRLPPFRIQKSGPQLQASFAWLNPSSNSNILLFIEDNSQFLQRARQLKLASLGRLTASIAHEIRNPLGAISHATQLLRESEQLDAEDTRLAEIILTHSERVNRIIEDVLLLSRRQEQQSSRINLYDWLSNFIQTYRESHVVSGDIHLEVRPRSTMVRVIPTQFEQILTNLFENGLRYSQQATGVASLTLRGGCDVILKTGKPFLHIIDEGAGISPEAEEHLFEPFHTTEADGTGLGLYISKELCEANQAQLSYRRTRSGKSCFSIHFTHPDRNFT